MGWLEFISSLSTALAWPAAVIVIVILLREPLKGLVSMLQRMKYKDFELEFGRKVAKAGEDADVEDDLRPSAELTSEETRIIELVGISPRVAVTEAWRLVEVASLEAAKALLGKDFQKKKLSTKAIRQLEKAGRIDPAIIEMMRDLRELRNDAVHSPEFTISPDAALEYARIARQLVAQMKDVELGSTET